MSFAISSVISLAINLGIPLFLLTLGYTLGKRFEIQHDQSIHEREKDWISIPALNIKTVEHPQPIATSKLVVGSVVVSVDYFKRFLTFFRHLFGGELSAYSSIIDRGRREAILRMKEQAPDSDLFLNCRLETSTISKGKRKRVACMEIFAYATAITYEKT
jgi:uncharacterized protein YbjQ (UPF0145 family)